MVEANGNLDQPLQEEPVRTTRPVPEILEGIMTLKETPPIKFIDALMKLIPNHPSDSIRKKLLTFKHLVKS